MAPISWPGTCRIGTLPLKRSPYIASKWAIEGFCEPRYARVRYVFEQNFAKRGEVGAAVCFT